MENPINFDDLDDTSLVDTGKTYRDLAKPADAQAPVADDISMGAGRNCNTVARFPCIKCDGKGKIKFWKRDRFGGPPYQVSGDCHRCGGKGFTKTNPAELQRARVANAQRATNVLTAKVDAWKAAHPVAAAWMANRSARSNFAASLLAKLAKYGELTAGQLAAVERCAAEDAERAQAQAVRKPDAEVAGAGFDRMLAAFASAKASGLKNPKFHVGDYVFNPAKAESTNAGCIYVKALGTYVGKITPTGAYFASRDARPEDKTEVARVGADPLAAAVLHGKQTGRCSCCGRELENAESVELGIGPICRKKWGL